MKVIVLSVLSVLLIMSMFAQSAEPTVPPLTRYLVPDRIRNTPAVDPDENGSGKRFYVTTFGLENFDGSQIHREKAPIPKPASLVRFGINNVEPPWLWEFTGIEINTMDEDVFNQGAIPINCYNNSDLSGLESDYPNQLTFTDDSRSSEGYMRYQSGTGSWASPVLYKDNNGVKHLIVLNKSGCLMSVNLSTPDLTVDWKVDLRAAERILDQENSHKYEFMATPVLIDNKIYVAGIKLIHVIDLSMGTPLQSDFECHGMSPDDYFAAPMVFDTADGSARSFYLISHLGRIYRFSNSIVSQLTTFPLGMSQSQPVIDADGHVYFATNGPNGLILSFIEQENRVLNMPSSPIQSIAITNYLTNDIVKSSIMTDFTRNMYMFRNDEVIRLTELYDFNPYSYLSDPIDYPDGNTSEWMQNTLLTTDGVRFPGNHSILSYHGFTKRTMLFTLNNGNSSMYGSSVIDYYPSNPDEYDISQRYINLSYVSYNNAYQVPSVQYSPPTILSNRQSWGGIAAYHSSIPGYLNALFGDECGGITSYNSWLSSASVGFDPAFDEGENAIPKMGYTKFMKNLNNIPSHNEVDVFRVHLYGLEYVDGSHTFTNTYARENYRDVLPDSQISVISATYAKLLPNRRYRVTWKNNADEVVFCDNIEVSDNIDCVIINADPDMLVQSTASDPDNETSWTYPQALHFNSVTLEDNAHWRVGDNSNITVARLSLGSGSRVTIGDGSLLSVGEVICSSPNGVAEFNVDGQHTGKLYVTSNLENAENSIVRFNGYNLQSPSYILNTVINKLNANLEFKSIGGTLTSDYVSSSIGSMQNRGRIDINDCVEFARNYIDVWQVVPGHTIRGTLKIKNGSDFGHLVWTIANGSIQSPFYIGDTAQTQPQRAKFTIKDAICTFKGYGNTPSPYSVYGNIIVKGNAKCVVNDSAILRFKTGSKLDLMGNLDVRYNGAELIANVTQTGGPGIIKFEEGVSISGMKPNPVPNDSNRFGDRIRTDENGLIEGNNNDNLRWLFNLRISTTNPAGSRWDGIYINTDYPNAVPFKLSSNNRSTISGIDRIYVMNPGTHPEISGIKFVNCTYGVYSTTDVALTEVRNLSVIDCEFEDCSYGVYIEDNASSNTPPSLSADISNCEFGGVDAVSGYNFVGIALRRAQNVSVNNCDFYRNGYGIISLQSSILVGGNYFNNQPVQDQPCRFYNNEKAGVCIEQSSSTQSRSLIFRNVFTGDFSTPTSTSGIGIWANESIVDVIDNDFVNLGWHGMLIKSYNWNQNQRYHGFAANSFLNNNGCELIGDTASLSSSRNGLNLFNDDLFTETSFIPNDPLANFNSWDKYILANLSSGIETPVADMRVNSFAQLPSSNRDRFYPAYRAFTFDPDTPTSLTDIIVTGMNQFYQGQFDESIQSMKLAVEVYPDSLLTKLAIDYLYLATRASTEDYSDLRAYLDLKIPIESLATYIKKEEIKTKCFIKEEDYLTAISRLQLILNNPESVADSLFALIDQAYCYMNLASEGEKALPNIGVKTPNFTSFLEFIANLATQTSAVTQNTHPIPIVLKIETNYPNPFNPATTIRFSVPRDGRVNVAVYNIRGQRVKQLLNENVMAGKHSIMWNGTDSHGRSVSSGLYFARIEQDKKHHIHKMMLIK